MTSSAVDTGRTGSGWLSAEQCRLEDFVRIVSESTDAADYPFADEVVQGVLVYRAATLRAVIGSPDGRRRVQAELARGLMDGPGLVVFKGAYDVGAVDRATAVFHDLIAQQKAQGTGAGDHFAKPGANDRVWNALEKLALRDAQTFVEYYSNDILNLVSVAWLGPGYQVTSQINVVNPGGAAQTAHRDYHLGFMSERQAARYPAQVHRLTPALTLQGAVAHSDMPVETGPTLYLPHSQKYEPGYLAFHLSEFIDYFEAHHVQLPLETGDAAFFNPALFHGAGHNRSADVRRMANLLQVSSAFGRAMESSGPHRDGTGGVPLPACHAPRRRRRGLAAQRHCCHCRGLCVSDEPGPGPASRRARAPDTSRTGLERGSGRVERRGVRPPARRTFGAAGHAHLTRQPSVG